MPDSTVAGREDVHESGEPGLGDVLGSVANMLEFVPEADAAHPSAGTLNDSKQSKHWGRSELLAIAGFAVGIAGLGIEALNFIMRWPTGAMYSLLSWLGLLALLFVLGMLGYAVWALREMHRENQETSNLLTATRKASTELIVKNQRLERLVNAQKRAIDQAAEDRERSLMELARARSARDLEIANSFNTLNQRISDFQGIVLEYCFMLAEPKKRLTIKTDRLKDELKTLMVTICDTAVDVIVARKDIVRPCSANIKWFVTPREGATGSPGYVVLARSNGADSDRYAQDRELLGSLVPVKANKVYHDIFDESQPEDFCCEGDIGEYLGRMREDPRFSRFTEPTALSARFYNSFVTVPVHGSASTGATLLGKEVSIPLRSNASFGIFCIDSSQAHYFNKEYDLKIMKELAINVFDCMRAYFAVLEMNSILARSTPRTGNTR